MVPDYCYCPFNGKPCSERCAIYVEPENGTAGRCGLIHMQSDSSANNVKAIIDGKRGDLSNDERSL